VVDDVLSVLVKEGRNEKSIKKAWKNALETRL
jgi:hypothetical protein